MNYGIEYSGEILRVFCTENLAKLYHSYQDYEYPEHYKVVKTNEPLTKFPIGSYYHDWNN